MEDGGFTVKPSLEYAIYVLHQRLYTVLCLVFMISIFSLTGIAFLSWGDDISIIFAYIAFGCDAMWAIILVFLVYKIISSVGQMYELYAKTDE